MTSRIVNWLSVGMALALILLFFGEGLAFRESNSITFDEVIHLAAGYSFLAHGNFPPYMSPPPFIRELCALPVYLWYRLPFDPTSTSDRSFLYDSSVSADDIMNLARLPNLVLGTVLVGMVGLWAYRLWGKGAGLLAMSLAALEPNLIAHASLVTTDLGAALFTFLTLYLLWEYTTHPSWVLLVGLGISIGLALVSKYPTHIVPVLVALILLYQSLFGNLALCPGINEHGKPAPLHSRLFAVGLTLWLVGTIAYVIITLTYGCEDISVWWNGLRVVREHNKLGHPAFFLGQYSRGGWWYYFPVAFALKTPLGSLTLIIASLVFVRSGNAWSLRQACFVLLPVVVWFTIASQWRLSIGLRFILPVYPFLFVAAGRLATVRLRRSWIVPLLLSLAVAGTAVSSVRVAPHYLAYFNELIGGPAEGYRYLADSNVDWGQDLKSLKAYMDREELPMIYLSFYGPTPPEYYGIHCQYLPGYWISGLPADKLPENMHREVLAISVLNLHGMWLENKDLYHWLYERTPVAKIGWSIFVYDVTHDADAHLQLARIYSNANRPDLAAREIRRVLALEPTNANAR